MQLHHLFIETAKKYKDKIAIHDTATRKKITYGQLLIACHIVAKKLKKHNDLMIGIMVPTSSGAIISIIASLMAGKIPVMINYSTGARNNCYFAQKNCGFGTIITSEKLLTKLKIKPVAGMLFLEDIVGMVTVVDKLQGAIKSKIGNNFVYKGSIDDNSVILFTSGSEKEPKIVPLTHKNIIANLNGIMQVLDITSDDIFVSVLPLFHVYGLTTAFWVPLTIGATIVTHVSPLEYRAIAADIKKYKATAIVATPTFFHGYLKMSDPGDFSSLKTCVAGGDKLTEQISKGYLENHGVKVLEGYGTTETSPVISTNTPKNHKFGSIGRPLPNVKVKIVDIESFEEVKEGCEGKILVKGDSVMNGYYQDLEETSLHLHGGWYDTGDMGCLDKDGYLWHKGRLKRFVKIAGEMISLVAVESELEKLIKKDSRCCVVSIPHPVKGAEIIAAVSEEIDAKKIRKKLAQDLSPLSVPKHFVFLENLPLMGSGKVNFREVGNICQEIVNNKKSRK